MSAGETLFHKEPTVTANKTKIQSGLCGDDCVAAGEGAVSSQQGSTAETSDEGVEEGNGVTSGYWCWPGLLCTAVTTSLGPADGAETSQR